MSKASEKEMIKNDSLLECSTDVHQIQLTQLQEQLVSVLIDNETLKSELTELKEKNKVESLLQELDFERKQNKLLSRELKEAKKAKLIRPCVKEEFVDLALEATEEIDPQKDVLPHRNVHWFDRFRDYLISGFYELMADFTDDPDQEVAVKDETKELTIKQLKENIMRFKSGLSPVIQLCKACYHLLYWKSPLSTLFIFTMYLLAVWCGWLLSTLLLISLTALAISYLQNRGWNINFGIFSDENGMSDKNGSLAGVALSDKFNLVLQVAKQVQILLGQIADGLEKIKNLLTWQHPSATWQLFSFIVVAFIMSCVMSGPALFRWLALYAGFKKFVIDYLYNRFPRFQRRHDSVYRIWKELPTDSDLEERRRKSLIDQQIIGKNQSSLSDADVLEAYSDSELTYEIRNFCTLFGLPLSERPLPGWEGGWRVTLIDKSRPLLKSLSRNGRLFLTSSFLCLERYKIPSPKNIMIPLKDITRIEKAKPYGWLPGSGMSIEISIIGFEQPYTFGAILNRDECFLQLVSYGAKLNLAWATEHASKVPSQSSADQTEEHEAQHPADKQSNRTFRMSDLKDMEDYEDLTTFAS